MRVEVGYTQESNGQWHKFMVELDETDLQRLLVEVGLPGDTHITTVDAYTLIMAEANRFSQVTRLQQWPQHPDNAKMIEDLKLATEKRAEILNRIKSRQVTSG